jgi:uncharacterized RDD family membrane protein YckC/cytoskeletal protein CcmA (bactofilin family)
MKFKNRNCLISLAIIPVLLSALTATAQPADSSPGATTNSSGGTVIEDPLTGSKTSTAQVSDTATTEQGRGGVRREDVVVFGKDTELKAGDSAQDVVVIGGSAKVDGKVSGDAVTIGGSATINGKVSQDVTAVVGDIEVTGEVGGEVVAVLGSVKIRKGAIVHHDLTAVGGKVEVEDGATIKGRTQEIDFGPLGGIAPKWLRGWFIHCFLMLRPLAPQVGVVWVVAGLCFLLYLLVAVLFPRPVQASVNELMQRPATTFFLGVLTLPLLAVVIFLLAITGVGLLVVPFILAALFFGALLGKVAFVESLGFRLARTFGGGSTLKSPVAFLLGAIIITLLYLVPILGLLTFFGVSLWGLGGAVTAAFGGLRREMPEKTPKLTPAVPEPVMTVRASGAASTFGIPDAPLPPEPTDSLTATSSGDASSAGLNQAPPAPQLATAPAPGPMPSLPETLAYPKASFWERMAAGFLDVVLVSILSGLAHPFGPFVALAYFAGMWTWKETTIGGIVIGLKVTRLDGQPVTFVVAIVRALAAAFSVGVLFLGFLWIAWDPDKQGWHDKIAGTVVLKLPRGTPLVCL